MLTFKPKMWQGERKPKMWLKNHESYFKAKPNKPNNVFYDGPWHITKKGAATKIKGITQSPILTFEVPKNATWVANMENHGCAKNGRRPKSRKGQGHHQEAHLPKPIQIPQQKKTNILFG